MRRRHSSARIPPASGPATSLAVAVTSAPRAPFAGLEPIRFAPRSRVRVRVRVLVRLASTLATATRAMMAKEISGIMSISYPHPFVRQGATTTTLAEFEDILPPDVEGTASAGTQHPRDPVPSAPAKVALRAANVLDLGLARLILAQVRAVSFDRLAPDPEHSRNDWAARDPDLDRLAEQLRESGRPSDVGS